MLKIILLADLHLGYNIGCSQMKQMVMKVKSAKSRSDRGCRRHF